MKIGNLEINLTELTKFVADAKKSCYAGNGEEEILPDGSKRLTLRRGPLFYEDIYSGFYQAPGRELVRHLLPGNSLHTRQVIWQMSYSGGMLPKYWGNEELAEETFTFLKEVLSTVTPDRPFRGRNGYPSKDGDFTYRTSVDGTIRGFRGHEEILHRDKGLVFAQDYIGGLAIPR